MTDYVPLKIRGFRDIKLFIGNNWSLLYVFVHNAHPEGVNAYGWRKACSTMGNVHLFIHLTLWGERVCLAEGHLNHRKPPSHSPRRPAKSKEMCKPLLSSIPLPSLHPTHAEGVSAFGPFSCVCLASSTIGNVHPTHPEGVKVYGWPKAITPRVSIQRSGRRPASIIINLDYLKTCFNHSNLLIKGQ